MFSPFFALIPTINTNMKTSDLLNERFDSLEQATASLLNDIEETIGDYYDDEMDGHDAVGIIHLIVDRHKKDPLIRRILLGAKRQRGR